jgi:hypothetical protein
MLTESIPNARRSQANGQGVLLGAFVEGSATMTIGGAPGLPDLAVRVTGLYSQIKKSDAPQNAGRTALQVC